VLIQANIDDSNPQLLSYVISRLFEAGALDVYQLPIDMKKNRLETQLNVVVRQ
jgi:pyridinium-3,5-bisthiocarboxylic acid mononucleotide nickel chelatase